MSLIDQAASAWGYDSNWNARRGGSDDLVNQFNQQYGADSNWNALRPSSAPSAAPAAASSGGGALAPSAPAAAPMPNNDASNATIAYLQQRDAQRDAENAQLKAATRDRLLQLMNQDTNAASINDADIKPQADAYRLAQDRSAQQQREQLAERAAFMGLNPGGQGSGAFETGIQGIQQQAGENTAAYNANLVGQKLQARRDQLMQALQLANALGANTEAQTLQSQLAQLDAQLRQTGMGIQSTLGQGQLGLGLLNSTLQNQQFYDRLGYDYAGLTEQANRDAFLAAM